MSETLAGSATARIGSIRLDEGSIVRWNPEIEHERDVAIFDLLEDNHFAVHGGPDGPFEVLLYLIKSQEIDIFDIPIVKVTEQYLRFLELISCSLAARPKY